MFVPKNIHVKYVPAVKGALECMLLKEYINIIPSILHVTLNINTLRNDFFQLKSNGDKIRIDLWCKPNYFMMCV